MQRIDNRLHAEVHDNGQGFDPAIHAIDADMASLRDRAARMGGELVIESSLGRGAVLRLDVPLANT
ncbi:hypothetical protein IHE49_11370 [Rhodanobacter sp. 7MK24]|uniref:hypothetical protein n=1 Tax=Rhodanobacter sp. 7MK24 TaxID=2775922 RepID=UPI00178779D2|nr:hypothetical protein [Rhodanobacter sp. 7MK24]MBD8881078.1 hypothetical protein [Rhodanobacter sp. 7MK24]